MQFVNIVSDIYILGPFLPHPATKSSYPSNVFVSSNGRQIGIISSTNKNNMDYGTNQRSLKQEDSTHQKGFEGGENVGRNSSMLIDINHCFSKEPNVCEIAQHLSKQTLTRFNKH